MKLVFHQFLVLLLILKKNLSEWDRDNPKPFPKILPILIKNGVPEALRGEVWQRITGASLQQEEIIEAYRYKN